jgi:IS1 family transposase
LKIKDTSLFDYLDFVLKVKDNPPKDFKPPVVLVNRWLSMANNPFCMIINHTTNKWCKVVYDFDITKFYTSVFPKYSNRISYIKKPIKEKEEQENKNLSEQMECSNREIDFFNKSLEEFGMVAK